MSPRGPIARRGAIIVWVAVLGVVLIGFVGLAMDAGVVLLAGSHLQIAADAGSLAGARLVREDDLSKPRQAAYDIAHENKATGNLIDLDLNSANGADGDIVIGRFYRFADSYADPPRCPTPPCFFPQLETPNAVRVHARRTNTSIDDQVPLVFGAAPVFNVKGVNVTRSAIAIIAGSTCAGLIVLCPDMECALKFSGNTDLVLQSEPGLDCDGAIQVNSDHHCAMCASGSALELTAPETNIVGSDPGYCFDGSPTINGEINPKSPPMPDPLENLPAPSWGAPHNPDRIDHTTINGGMTSYTPGYYPGGIRITASGDFATLSPGVYVVDGEGLYVNGGNLTAHGVMFYVIGTGRVYLGGNGIIDIRPSGYDAIPPSTKDCELVPYCGISIFQARDNINPATIIGTSTMNLEGTYYFPVAPVEIGGEGIAIGNQLIACSLWMHGRGTYTLQYDGRFPAPGSKVFLVQ